VDLRGDVMNKERILLVDDEKKLVNIIKINLEDAGYEVIPAFDGKEALERVSELKPDLVVLDVMLPKIDGWEVLSHLRNNPRTKPIPVIMLTAKSEGISKLFGFDLGADDYVTKPFDIAELVARVSAILRRFRLSKKSAAEKQLSRIPVLGGAREVNLVDQQEIFFIDAVHNYTYLHTYDGKYLTRFTLNQLEEKLADFFMRVHRGYIVNLNHISGIFSPQASLYKLMLKDEAKTQLPVSRHKVKSLKTRLNL